MEKVIIEDIVINIFNGIPIHICLERLKKLFGEKWDDKVNKDSISIRINEIVNYQNQLEELIKIPEIEQRSEEWYKTRHNLITASDFAQALGKGKFGTVKQFYRNKCGYEENKFNNNLEPLQWGIRYEPVATMIYEKMSRTTITEFGLIQHTKHDFIGASPDGINNLGIMLEIKCPWRRKKTETIPEQYEYQIQGQLEVCNLEECDYFECYFKEYDNYEDMVNDGEIYYKGIIFKINNEYKYGYVNDLNYNVDKYDTVYYYGLKDSYTERVHRDQERFKMILNDLGEVWKKVKEYRENKELYMKDNAVKKRVPKLLFRKNDDDNI